MNLATQRVPNLMAPTPPSAAMPAFRSRGAFDVIAIGASSGGLAAVTVVLSGLPRSFPAAILLVQHISADHPSLMADILSRRTPLLVREAAEGDRVQGGAVLIAPPGTHLIAGRDGSVSLQHSERVHMVRPSADVLFASCADSYGRRTIGVVLTGLGGDGAPGATAIKHVGGVVIAQDERTSVAYAMPAAAIATGSVDYVLPVEQIAAKLCQLVAGSP